MGTEFNILSLMAAGAILAGVALKGVFTLPRYRITRRKTILALLAAGFLGASGGVGDAFNRNLGTVLEPWGKAGRQLGEWVPAHASLLRQVGLLLAGAAGLWGLVKSRRKAFPLILLLLALVFGLTGAVLLSQWNFTWGQILLALGFAYALAAGIVSAPKRRRAPMEKALGKPNIPGSPLAGMTGPVLLALIVLLAFALRAWQIGDISLRFDHYETDYSRQALNILQGRHNPRLWTSTIWRGLGHYNFSPVYSYCVAFFFRTLGVSLASLRLTAVAYGTASVLLAYGIFNILFGRRLGLLSAFLMAVSPLAINYSRIGLLLASTQTVSLLVTFLLLRSLLQRSVTSYVLLGISCAFAGYFYSPAKYPILLSAFLVVLFIFFHRGYLRRAWVGLILAGLVIVLIGEMLHIPVGEIMAPKFAGYESVWHRTRGHHYTPQADYVRGAPLVWENFQLLVRSFFYDRKFNYDPWPRGNLFFGPVIPVLTLLGIGFSLGRLKSINYRLLLFFLAAFLIPNLLSRPPVMVRRMMVSWPFIFCLAAIPLSQLIGQGRRALGRGGSTMLAALVILGLGAHASFNWHVFLHSREHAGRWEDERHFDDYLLNLEAGGRLYVVPISDLSRKTIEFRFLDREGRPNRQYRFIRAEEIAPLARELGQGRERGVIFTATGKASLPVMRRLARETGGRLEKPVDPHGRRIGYALIYSPEETVTPQADAAHPGQ